MQTILKESNVNKRQDEVIDSCKWDDKLFVVGEQLVFEW